MAPAIRRSRTSGSKSSARGPQPLEMQRRALDHGDEIGGRARPLRLGEFDGALGLQRGGDAVDRLEGRRLARSREIAAEPRDAKVRDAVIEGERRRQRGDVGLRRIGFVAAEHRVVGQREIGDAAGERAEVIEARDERERAARATAGRRSA